MFILGNFLRAVSGVLDIVLELFKWTLIIRAVLSWVNPDPYNPIVQFLYRVTEPILYQIRRKIPSFQLGIDFSVFVAILGIMFLQLFLVRTISDIALRLMMGAG